MSEEFDLSKFEVSMIIRQTTMEDVEPMLEMQRLCFSRRPTCGRT
jgi:hypothetical protein